MNAETKDNVARLPERDGKVLNVEWTVNIGKDRQARILTDFPQNMDPARINQQLDMIDDALTRQKARHEIAEIQEEVDKAEQQNAQWQADHDEAEHEHKKALAVIEERVAEVHRGRGDFEQTARQEHARSDKRGDFVPKGQVKNRLDSYDRTVEKIEDERKKLEAEREVALKNLKINMRANDKLIARLKAKIAAKQKLIGIEA